MACFLLHRPPLALPDSSGSFRVFALSLAALLAVAFLPLPSVVPADLFRLVYKGCSNQTVGGGSAALDALASNLTSQADSSKFYQAAASSADGGPSFLGLFQCRGDLSASDCSACVARVLPMWSSLCGADSAAVRVQLTGCYALYQVSGFPQVPGTELLYKACGSGGSGDDFEGRRDTAFAQLQSGVAGGGGFYATSYGSVYALAQCEGDLAASDCSDCVTQAIQKSKAECGGSASGQVYLNKCYISYRSNREDGGHRCGSYGRGGVLDHLLLVR
ncbi:plasmodesmata-located protein 2-like isoform X3 [Curcuma longa]|uniref:plasmodesmata-located protein 2-like isoform X3 n=1 Tax=Curcuma longa TaxID=136217 RepID=UPI003D9E1AA5